MMLLRNMAIGAGFQLQHEAECACICKKGVPKLDELNLGANTEHAEQVSLLAGQLCTTSTDDQQEQPIDTAPPVPPDALDKQCSEFLIMLVEVHAHHGDVVLLFVMGQPNPAWKHRLGLFKKHKPATDNRPGALRIPEWPVG